MATGTLVVIDGLSATQTLAVSNYSGILTYWNEISVGGTLVATGNPFPVSGAVTISSGTISMASLGSVAGGAAGSFSNLAGAVYVASAPTLTAGQQAALAVDASGNLKVNVVAGGAGGGNVNITQVGGTSITAGQAAMTASLPVVIASNQSAVNIFGTVTPTGTLSVVNVAGSANIGTVVATGTVAVGNAVTLASGGTVTVTGTTAVSSLPALVAGSANIGTVTVGSLPALVAGSANIGTVSIAGTVPVSGTVTTSSSGTQTVAGTIAVSGGTVALSGTLPVTGTVSMASLGSVAGGTAGTNSNLAGGVFVSAVPTLTANQQAALALDASGFLKVNVAAGGAGGGNVNLTQVGSSAIAIGQAAMAASLPVVIASNQSSVPVSGTVSMASLGSVAGGTAGTSSNLSGGVFVTAVPTLTANQQAALALDASGFLKVNVAAGGAGGGNVNLTQVGSSAIAIGQGTMAASLPVVIASNQSAVPVSGTITANGTVSITGTVPVSGTVSMASLGSVAGGTAGSSSNLAAGVFVSAVPTLTAGQQAGLALDASGFLKVNVAAGGAGGGNVNLTQVGSSAIAIGQGAMAASLPVVIASNQSAVPVSGTVTANGTVSLSGTIPVSGTVAVSTLPALVAGSANIGTVAVTGTVPVSGTVALSGTSAVSGAVTVSSGTVTLSGSPTVTATGTVALAAGTAVVGVVGNTQGSTTSGQSGPLIQAAVLTSAPTYVTAQTSPLTMTTAGALRVDGSAVTQPVSGTVAVSTLPALVAGSANIGTVTATGTVSTVPTGTTTITGTVTPTGTLSVLNVAGSSNIGTVSVAGTVPVSGTVTITPSGTQTVAGTVTVSNIGSLALTPTVTTGVASSLVLKASAGTLYGAYVTTVATGGYFMVFNATTAPADGAVTPQQVIVAPANSTVAISFNGSPNETYTTGITLVFSSTGPFTKTASATAFMWGQWS
jgi:hypothetical protein